MEAMEERLQKIMAQAGLGSRRDCEEFILAGRVRVNGTVAVIGQKADPVADKISLDMRLIKPAEQKVYIALHKPKYVLSTVDAEQGDSRQTVRDLVAVSERLYPVGRLDFESEGLVLMTNDGELAQKLTHPSHGHSKEYRVLLARQPDAEQIATWQRGVVLEDGYKTQRADVRTESLAGKGAWLRIVMREGRKRQIREIGAMLALPVVRIVRVRIGSLLLGGLKPSEWRYLTPEEIKALKEDRPGLAPFPDMTRKSPLKGRPKMVRRVPGRMDQAGEREKTPGRTAPPGSREKAPGRTAPPGGREKAPGRTAPPGGREKAPGRTAPPGGREKAPGRTAPPDGREKAPGRTGPPGSRGKAPGRTRPPGGTAPDRSRSSGATGRPSERHEQPKGVRRPAIRKPK
jgi:23S rRNA pseudouridine2605 synthase